MPKTRTLDHYMQTIIYEVGFLYEIIPIRFLMFVFFLYVVYQCKSMALKWYHSEINVKL